MLSKVYMNYTVCQWNLEQICFSGSSHYGVTGLSDGPKDKPCPFIPGFAIEQTPDKRWYRALVETVRDVE